MNGSKHEDDIVPKDGILLDDVLARSLPFIYFSCGTMPHWEAVIYAHDLPPGQ